MIEKRPRASAVDKAWASWSSRWSEAERGSRCCCNVRIVACGSSRRTNEPSACMSEIHATISIQNLNKLHSRSVRNPRL